MSHPNLQNQAFNNDTGYANSSNATANSILQTALPAITQQLEHPGLTPGQQAAQTADVVGGANATFGGAKQSMENQAAKTNNSAGVVAGEDQLARDKASTIANAENQNTMADAQFAAQQKDQAAALMSSLFGTNKQAATSGFGSASGVLQGYKPNSLMQGLLGVGAGLAASA
jgi:hypothetical protein